MDFDLSDPIKAKRLFDAIMGPCVICGEHPAMDRTNRECERCFTLEIEKANAEAAEWEADHPIEAELFKAECKGWLRSIGLIPPVKNNDAC